MGKVEILAGPSARVILSEASGSWSCVVDATAMTGALTGVHGLVGPVAGFASRGEALEAGADRIRSFLGDRLHPQQAAWLAGIAPEQPDLFAPQSSKAAA